MTDETGNNTENTMQNDSQKEGDSSLQTDGQDQDIGAMKSHGEAPAFPEFKPQENRDDSSDYDTLETLGMNGDVTAVYNVPVQISAVLGRATMPVSQLLKLGRGAVVELDRRVGESIDIFVNNRLVARGEVVVIDERLGITMTEIIKGHS